MDMENVLGEVEANGGRGHGKLLLQCGTTIRSLLRSGAVFPINGSFRDEHLNETLFSSLAEAREKITAWKEDYNRQRPHSSLGNLTPEEFAMKSRLETQAA